MIWVVKIYKLNEVNSKNTRFDPDLLEFRNIVKQLIESIVYTVASLVINMNLWTCLKLAQGAIPMDEN